MNEASLRLATWAQAAWLAGLHRARRAPARRDQRGEGVISAAIAVLVMAALGALMWVGFRTLWQETEANTRDRVAEIGR
jgi:hypothetical protein